MTPKPAKKVKNSTARTQIDGKSHFQKKNLPPAVPLVPHGSKWRVTSRRRPHGTPYKCRGDTPTSTLQQDAISRTFFFCSYTIQTHTGIGCNNFIFLTFSVLLSTKTPRATQVHSWCGKRYIRNFHHTVRSCTVARNNARVLV